MLFYLTPEQDDFNKIPELQVCIAEALYDVDSIVVVRLASVKRRVSCYHFATTLSRSSMPEVI